MQLIEGVESHIHAHIWIQSLLLLGYHNRLKAKYFGEVQSFS